MPLDEEKTLILKMLQEGKITVEEASKLIEALESGSGRAQGEGAARQQRQSAYQDETTFQKEAAKMRDRVNEWRKDFRGSYSQNDFDHMIDEFSSKAEKLGKNVANTTFGIVDKLVDFVGSFVDTNAFNIFGSYTTVERSFEAAAAEGMELYIEGVNGPILVKKHLDDKVVIKSRVKSPINNADSILKFENNENSISMKLNKIGNISVSHEVFIPAVKFKNIKFETANGKIYVEDALAENFEGVTKNGHIELMGVNSDGLSVATKNAKIQISYVIGRNININTNNSVIDIKHIKAENINAVTMNGRILIENAQNYENVPEMKLYLKTSNGGVKVNMNDMDNRGYKIKAQTTGGGINLLIPEITYHNINKQAIGGSFIEAESSGYDTFAQKVNINAETTNGYIEIVK